MALNYQAAVNITANYTGERQVQKAKDDFRQLGTNVSSMKTGFDNVGTALKTLASAFVIREAVSFGKNLLDLGEQLNELRQKTGISVETLGSLKAAAEDNGVGFDELESALRKYSTTLGHAQAGNLTALSGFKMVGLSLKDLKGSTPDETLQKLADRFQSLQDGPAKAAAAVSIFGRQGATLIPLLNQGGDALDKFGLKISTDFAARADVFNDTMKALKRSTEQSGINALSGLLPTMQEIANAFRDISKNAGPSTSAIQKISDGLRIAATGIVAFGTIFGEGLDTIYTGLETVGTFLGEWFASRVDRFKTFGEEVGLAFKGQFDKISAVESEFQSRSLDSQKRFGEESQRIRDEYMKRTQDRMQKLQAFSDAVNKNIGNNEKAAAATKPDTTKTKVDTNGFDPTQYAHELDLIRQLTEEKKKLADSNALEAEKVNLSTAEYKKRKIELDDNTKNSKELSKASEQNRGQIKQLQDAVTQLKEAEIDQAEAQKQSFGAGAKEALREYMETAQDTAAQTKSLFTSAFKGIEDAMVELVKNGKLSFASLADTIETELIRIAVQKSIAFGISAAAEGAASYSAAFANGGIMTGSGPVPLRKYANGGVATSPQLALFGEGSKPEAYVPLPDGRSIPVSMKGGSNAGGTSVQVNVTINNDGTSQTDTMSDDQRGKQFGKLVEAQMTEFVLKHKRPGGLLA